MSDYARGYQAALIRAAKVADLFEEVNFSLCHDSIILDPVLANARQPSPRALTEDDFRESEKHQDNGTIHSSMAHAARNIAAAIRALPEESA